MRAALVMIAIVTTGCSCGHKGTDVPVRAAVAEAQTMLVPVAPSGPSTLQPSAVADVKAGIAAPIRSILVHTGDVVTAGDLMAVLDNRDLLAQRESALAALAAAHAEAVRAAATLAGTERSRTRTANPPMTADQKVAAAEQQFNAVNQQLETADVIAPISGTVTDQVKSSGDAVSKGAVIFRIADSSVLQAHVQLRDPSQLVQQGQACIFRPNSGAALQGNVLKPVRNGAMADVVCQIYNTDGSIAAGTEGTMSVSTGASRAGVVVPASAVHTDDDTGKKWVYTVDKHLVAHATSVQTGTITGSFVEVAGLRPGNTVVVQGDRVRDNSRLQIAK